MTRGRRSEWERALARLTGSAVAKERLRAVLLTMLGQQTIAEVAAQLGLSERRLHGLRGRMLQAALQALEPLPAGRPPRLSAESDARTEALEAELRDLRLDLRAAQIREEVALVMPQLLARSQRRQRPTANCSHGRRPAQRSGACGGCRP
jgi:hypothetical protein